MTGTNCLESRRSIFPVFPQIALLIMGHASPSRI